VAWSSAVLLSFLLAQAGSAAEAIAPPTHPTLRVSSGLSSQRAADPRRRTLLVHHLDLESSDWEGLSMYVQLGWVNRFDRGPNDAASADSQPGNVVAGGRWTGGVGRLGIGELGISLVLPMSNVSLDRPTAATTYAHAVAAEGGWDAWMWAQGRMGGAVPGRLRHAGVWRGWPIRLQLEGALAGFLPRADFGPPGQTMLQLAASPTVWLRPWLSVTPRVQTVWLPTGWSDAQTAAGLRAAVARGRIRVAGQWLANLDHPFGWTGAGRQISAFQLQLELWPSLEQ
jgi:hypothetical protein